MREALLICESAELGNLHRSIYEALRVLGFPCFPLVLPRDGCATPEENAELVASAAADDRFGMVILVGPNDHLTEVALHGAWHQGKPIVSIQIDDPWGLDHAQVRLTGYYNDVLTSDPDCVARYLRMGVKYADFLPFGIDPQVFRPCAVRLSLTYGMLFLGSAFSRRMQSITSLRAAGMNVVCAGPSGTPLWNIQRRFPAWIMPSWFQRSQVCLSFSDQPDGNPGMKIRPFEIAASGGGGLLSERWPGSEYFFTEGTEAMWFTGDDELLAKSRWMMAGPNEVQTMADRAAERTLSEHTWQERLRNHVVRWGKMLQ